MERLKMAQKLIQAFWRVGWHYLILSNEPRADDLASPMIGICSPEKKKTNMQVHKESNTRICTFEALFGLAESWNDQGVYLWRSG